jgi:hypothetical protein
MKGCMGLTDRVLVAGEKYLSPFLVSILILFCIFAA